MSHGALSALYWLRWSLTLTLSSCVSPQGHVASVVDLVVNEKDNQIISLGQDKTIKVSHVALGPQLLPGAEGKLIKVAMIVACQGLRNTCIGYYHCCCPDILHATPLPHTREDCC